jgi:fibronectin-binding autotransporter adhesin
MGILTLSGVNTYTGNTMINSGTLALAAVPANTETIFVASNATFQLNSNYKTLTLTGGGTWNVNANNGGGTAVSYSTSENISAFTGTVNVLFGSRYWLGTQNSMPAGIMYVANGGQLGISYNGLLTGNVHIAGASWGGTGGENDGALRLNSSNGSGGNFAGTLTLDADAGVAAGQTGGSGTVSANIGGAHTLTIVNGTVTLSGNNNFGALNIPSGSTAIAGSSTAFGGGALVVNGTVQLNGFGLSTANLSGTGTVSGAAPVNGSLAPGNNSIGMLTFNDNLALSGGSTTVMELNKTLLTNDVAQVAGTLTYGGTLVLTNLGGTLTNGDSFKLFNAAIYNGAFTNIVPAIPAVNLAWNTNSLTNGVLKVVASPTSPPQISRLTMGANNLVFSGAGGVPNWTYYILASSNLTLPENQWTIIATNIFDANGNFNFTNPSNPSMLQQFYLLQLQ